MRVTKQVLGRPVQFGGEQPAGWLPDDAAPPRTTPVVDQVLDIRIIEAEGGFILAWQSRTTNDGNDTWHETVDEAIQEAGTHLGVKVGEWEDVNEEFEGDA